jgi:glucokinase
MGKVIGVDVGGGGVRAAVVEDGVVGPVTRLSLRSRDIEAVTYAIKMLVRGVGLDADSVGVGMPGFVRDGVVVASPNFPDWEQVPLAALLSEALGKPVAVENDANAAALGAWLRNGGSGDLVQLTLGTGVGGGVVQGGRLLRGAGGTGAELGHIYVGGERPCGCGGVGCLETWCSTVGLVAAAAERGHTVRLGHEVVLAARAGEAWAIEVMTEAGFALGRGLTTLVNLFNPDVVRLCGGLAAAQDLLAPHAEGWMRRHCVQASVERVEIVWAWRADEDAIFGAATAAGHL